MAEPKSNLVEFPTPSTAQTDPFADPFALDPNRAPRTLPREVAAGQASKVHGVGNAQLEIDNANARITFRDESDTPRMIIGLLPDDTIGVVISKPGQDVFDAFDD